MPEFDAMYFVGLVSRLAHILSAIVLVGGLVYLRMMVVPLPATPAAATDSAQRYFMGLRSKWAVVVMVCAALLILSGLYNYIVKVQVEKFPMPYHALFGVKFLLGLVVIFAASITAGRREAADRARGRIGIWLNLAIACAILVVVIASTMRTFSGTPKTDAPEQRETAAAAGDATRPGPSR